MNGSGSGYGYGDGYGDGYGYGYNDGDGSGYGYGISITKVGDFDVNHLAPWDLVRIGCEVHSLNYWQENWKAKAREHDLSVPPEEAQRILNMLGAT